MNTTKKLSGLALATAAAGLFAMARGGEFNRRHGNRLMRWRVLMQGAALLLLVLLMLATRD